MDNLYNTLVGLTDGGAGDDDTVLNPPNEPVIPKNLPENTTMQLVKYQAGTDGAEGTWVPDTDGKSWSYVAGTGNDDNTSSKWANAKVTVDGVESYFVWIPRFAYKIDSTTHKIDVVFLKDKTDKYIDEKGQTQTAKRATDDDISNEIVDLEYYTVHPAFTTDAETGGGWNEELPGLWVGKYETSLVNKETKQNINTSSEIEGNILLSEHEDRTIAVQPNMSSWRYCTIGNMYTNAKNYSTNLNSHMLKNSEWGAVAYLTHSKYGRNGHEISINNSSDYITGTGENLASSTGNEYGIYDLSGGAYEYVAAYYKDGNSTYLSNGSALFAHDKTNKTSDEYATAYTGTSESTNYKKGDATYETSGWNLYETVFVNSDCPFFSRGGSYHKNSYAGVFCYNRYYGIAIYNDSFRMCLAVM